MQTIESKGLSAGSLFKLLFVGLLPPLFLFGLGCGIASFLGHSTIKLNDQNVYGAKGLVVGMVLGVVLPIMFSALLWCLMTFGIWVWTSMRRITLRIKD